MRQPDEPGHGHLGAMSGAETDMWDRHLEDLLQLFVTEVYRCGGPSLDPTRLRRHTLLDAAMMGSLGYWTSRR